MLYLKALFNQVGDLEDATNYLRPLKGVIAVIGGLYAAKTFLVLVINTYLIISF